MARMRFNHNTFATGIISKRVQGNTDFEKYNNSLDECVNFQIQHTGGCFKRGGSYFLAETKNNDQARLIPFIYSTDQSYVCEFGDKYVRFHSRYGTLRKSDGEILEIETPFEYKDLSSIKHHQSGNILYLITSTGIYELIRNDSAGDSAFSFNESSVEYSVEPLTFINTKEIALKPSGDGANGSTITVTAQKPKKKPDDPEVEPDEKYAPLFFPDDVTTDNQIRDVVFNYMNISTGETIGRYWIRIIEVQEPAEGKHFRTITGKLDKDLSSSDKLPNTDPVLKWQISAFNASRGFPKAAAIYEGRQFLANNKSYPLGIWGSSTLYQDWFNYLTGSNAGDAVQNITSMEKSDEILWLVGQSKLFIGTRGGIYIAGAASYNDEAITPASFRVRLFQSIGASSLQPITAMDTVFFTDSSGRNVHEIALTESGVYQAYDLSLLANDLTQSGIVAHTWQQTPIKTYWCAVNDGYLCSLTYLKNNDILAWAKHVISGKNVKVTSLATIHEDRNDYVWMIVQREINGNIVRYIEYMHPMYDPMGQEEFKQFYVDSGVTKEQKYTINKIVDSKPESKTSKSKNANVQCNMTPLRVGESYENEYLVCFKVPEEKQDAVLKSGNIFLAKNITNTGFDMFHDTRSVNQDIPYKKINPLDYPNYNFNVTARAHFKISNIIGIESAPTYTFIKCDIAKLRDNDRVVIQNSGIRYANDPHTIDFPDQRTIFAAGIVENRRDGFFLKHLNTGVNILTDPSSVLSVNAELYKGYNNITGCNLGTNCVIQLKQALPSSSSIGNDVYINKVYGMIEINKMKYKIAWISQDRKSIALYDIKKSPSERNNNYAVIDSSSWSEYDTSEENNGNLYLYFNTIEGLEHLKGQEVSICADGNKYEAGSVIVPNDGVINLNHPSMYCSAGLKMKSVLKTVPFSGGSVIGSSVGTVGSQKDAGIYLYHSLGGRYGAEADYTFAIPYKYNKNTTTDSTQNLYTGLIKLPLPNSKNIYNRTIYIEHSDPLSFNILSVAHDINVSDS